MWMTLNCMPMGVHWLFIRRILNNLLLMLIIDILKYLIRKHMRLLIIGLEVDVILLLFIWIKMMLFSSIPIRKQYVIDMILVANCILLLKRVVMITFILCIGKSVEVLEVRFLKKWLYKIVIIKRLVFVERVEMLCYWLIRISFRDMKERTMGRENWNGRRWGEDGMWNIIWFMIRALSLDC
jgi:hypothetical protein